MTRRMSVCVALALALTLAAAPSAKADHVFFAFMDGSQENPPTPSTAFGFAIFVLNDNLDALKWGMSYVGLTGGNTVGAHFHRGAVGVNGPIVRGYTPLTQFTSPNAYVTQSWLSTDSQSLTVALALDMFNSNLYFNVHTQQFGGGEIRGQVYYFYSY